MKVKSSHQGAVKKKKSFRFYFNLIFITALLFLLAQTGVSSGFGSQNLTLHRPLVQAVSVDVTPPAPYPQKVNGYPQPVTTAKGVIVIDVNSQKILFEKNSHQRLYPASTTKMLTALIALEYYDMDTVLTVQREKVDGSVLGLKKGEQMTVYDLLRATLISSSNDAALVLADNYPGGEKEFVALMNRKAREMSLTESSFKNPTGLHDPGHFSSARDLARLGTLALKNAQFKKLVATRVATLTNLTTNAELKIENLNQLLGTTGVDGIKTGFTEEAGGCLVATKQIGKNRVISVVLGSEDRFLDTDKLLSFVFNSYRW